MNPVISVVIPTFNRKDITVEAIKSVLMQEPKNYEIIVVDDGSTDGTSDYLKSLRLPIRVTLKENGGVASARNEGIKNAKGEYIAFLDSDDLWLPGILKEQLGYLKTHPNIPLVYTDQFIESDGKRSDKTRFEKEPPKSKFIYPGFVDLTPIHSSSVMVRKSIFDDIGYFNEDLKVHEDTDMWNRISERHKLGYIEKPLAIFRWEKDPEHVLKANDRRKFVDEGRKYMQLYVNRRKGRKLTDEEKKAIDDSYAAIDKIELEL